MSDNPAQATLAQLFQSASDFHRQGQTARAESLYRQILARQPQHGDALWRLALLKHQAQDLHMARQYIERALHQDASKPAYWMTSALVAEDEKQWAQALQAYDRILAMAPQLAAAHNGKARVLEQQGDLQGAQQHWEQAVALQPNLARAWNNLGALHARRQQTAAAHHCWQQAAQHDGQYARPRLNLGLSLLQHRQVDAAQPWLQAAYALAPDSAEAQAAWEQVAQEQGEHEQVEQLQLQNCLRHPNSLNARWRAAMNLPSLAESSAGIDATRTQLQARVAALQEDLPRLQLQGPVWEALRHPLFYLAYQQGTHSASDAQLLSQIGDLCQAILQKHAPETLSLSPRPARSRPRVGVISSSLRDCTVGHYFQSWIQGLARSECELYLFDRYHAPDAMTQHLAQLAQHYQHRPDPQALLTAVQAAELDVLIYPEVGMDMALTWLSHMRLAPMQIAAWGHPITSGSSQIDVYLSVAAMEPEHAQAHYRERLLLLPGLGTQYQAPKVGPAYSRAALGLPTGPLFLCPQSLFKIHPEQDALWAELLRAEPRAHLALVRHPSARYTERLQQRLQRHGVPSAQLLWLEPRPRSDYLRMLPAFDAQLDTLHFSGGNTTLDAIAAGLPVVTLPGATMRSRQSLAMLQQIGAHQLIASNANAYLNLALQLGSQPAARQAAVDLLQQQRQHLFNDPAPVQALQQLLHQGWMQPTGGSV